MTEEIQMDWAWKSFTAKKINQLRKSSGVVWAREYHDRFIRDNGHFHSVITYIENNPVKAKLVASAKEWPWSSARLRDKYERLCLPAK